MKPFAKTTLILSIIVTAVALLGRLQEKEEKSLQAQPRAENITRHRDPEPAVEAAVPAALTFDRERILLGISAQTDPELQAWAAQIMQAATTLEKGQTADLLARRGDHESIALLLGLAAVAETAEDRAAILEGLQNLTHTEGLETLASALTATRDGQFLAVVQDTLARAAQAETLDVLVAYYRERNDGPGQKNAVLETIASLRNPTLRRALVKLTALEAEPGLADAAERALVTHHGATLVAD